MTAQQIRRIDRVGSFGILQNWHCDAGVSSFEHCNVVYGTNGSGKSTLAALIAKAADYQASTCRVVFKTEGSNGSDETLNAKSPLWNNVFVFNQDYVSRNLRFDASGGAQPVQLLQVGEKRIDAERIKEEISKRVQEINLDLDKWGKSRKKAEDARSKLVTNTARDIALLLGPIDSRYESRSYKAPSVKKVLEKESERLREWDTIDVDVALDIARSPELTELVYNKGSIETADLIEEVKTILLRSVASESIQDLVDHPDWARWVREGLTLHSDRDTCIYCDNVIEDERRADLAGHFDDAFTKLSTELDALAQQVLERQNDVEALRSEIPDTSRFDSTLREEFSTAESQLLAALEDVESLLKTLAAEIQRKQDHPFSSLAMVDITAAPIATNENIAATVIEHNRLASKGAERRRAAADQVEIFKIGSIREEADHLAGEIEESATKQSRAIAESKKLNDERTHLSVENLDPQPLADSLNSDLKALLGRDELQFSIVDDGYQIFRSGHAASGLSEGEQNAISLLYFLRSLEEHDITFGDCIVVIDDPISSLDSSNLLAASSFIWSRLVGKCRQIFLFSHNFELFRAWSQLLNGAKGHMGKNGRKGLLYELRPRHLMSGAESRRSIELRDWPKPPEATRLRSEYHYLFSQMVEGLNELRDDPSEACLMNSAALLPNATRRVLEGFLAFRCPQNVGSLREQLRATKPPNLDDVIWQRVLVFVNDHSHMEHADTNRHLERPEVLGHLQAVLTFLNEIDPAHVSAMCQALHLEAPQL